MADKYLGRRTFESLTKARLSVRYTRLVNERPSLEAAPVPASSSYADSAPNLPPASKPTLRTVVESCPPLRMKTLLGPRQGIIRMLQSPAWLLDEQRKLSMKEGQDLSGEKLVAAGNVLLDLCRFVETLLNRINRGKAASAKNKAVKQLTKKFNAIWNDLYSAVECLRSDCGRSHAFVRHAAMEVLNLGVELEDGHSYKKIWARKLLSRLKTLSAGIADAQNLLPRTLERADGRSKSIKKILSPYVSNFKKSEAEKRVGILDKPSDITAGLASEIKVISDALDELIHKLGEPEQCSVETLGMFKLCAARLKRILSSSYSLKRWELELHRTHYFFRQATSTLSTTHEMPDQGKAMSPGNLLHVKIAVYISDRFEDTMGLILKKADPGYARHNFIGRKQSSLLSSARLSRPPLSSAPILQTTSLDYKPIQPSLTSLPGRQDTTDARRTITASITAVASPSSSSAAGIRRADSGIHSKSDKDEQATKRAEIDATLGGVQQTASISKTVPTPRKGSVKAAKMSLQWKELDALSQQKHKQEQQ